MEYSDKIIKGGIHIKVKKEKPYKYFTKLLN